VKDDVRKKRIYTIAISMLQTLGINEMDLLFRMTEIAERAANCPNSCPDTQKLSQLGLYTHVLNLN